MIKQKLPIWTDHWALSGDMLNCTECHAPQFIQHRELAFVHGAECSREGPDQYPYLELLEIMKIMQHID